MHVHEQAQSTNPLVVKEKMVTWKICCICALRLLFTLSVHLLHLIMSIDSQPIASTSYIPPTKHILSKAHLAAFQRSRAHDDILTFIDQLNDSIIGVKLTQATVASEVRRLRMPMHADM